MVLGLMASAAFGMSATAAWGMASKSSQLFGASVYKGPGQRRSIALTFDDGPSESTLPLLDYLAQQNVRATFFVCGMNVRRLPAVARAVKDAGHQIGNHTDSHPLLALKRRDFIEREFANAQKSIEAETGVIPDVLRAPYGMRWWGMREAQSRLQLLGVTWTVIGYDWKWPAQRIAEHVLTRSRPGGIICLHDGRGVQVRPDNSAMLQAIRTIVPGLKDQGYSFETIADLLRPDASRNY